MDTWQSLCVADAGADCTCAQHRDQGALRHPWKEAGGHHSAHLIRALTGPAMEAAWSPSVLPAKLDAAFCRGLGKALLQAAATATTGVVGGSGGASLAALPAAECLKLLRAAEKLLKAEPTLVHVSLCDAGLDCMGSGVCACRPFEGIPRCPPACLPTARLPTARLPTACLRVVFAGLQADPQGAEVVVVGDLHGQYQDLLAM